MASSLLHNGWDDAYRAFYLRTQDFHPSPDIGQTFPAGKELHVPDAEIYFVSPFSSSTGLTEMTSIIIATTGCGCGRAGSPSAICINNNSNKLRGRRVRPTRYASARVQEHNFIGWPWQLIAHVQSAYQF